MSKVVRGVKNITKGYTNVQVKVRNATSNDPWGPTGTEMYEIAQLTYNNTNDFYEIMDMLDKRLNDKGKNWRHVLKSLKVLDYSLHEGSELVVTWARKNVYIIKTLREFQYVDDEGKDVGQNVRVSAKELTSLIMNEERLQTERSDRKNWKSRVTGIEEYGPQGSGYPGRGESPPRRKPERRQQRPDEEDREYQLALEASKYEAEEDKKRRDRSSAAAVDEDDLAKAIRLSKEEEELRRRELEESNSAAFFADETPTQSQPTGNNQGYQQQGAVDWFGNPVDQLAQQPQNTGYLNNVYSQSTGFQPQQTGFQPQQTGFSNGFQPQQTGFDALPFQQQQQNYLQPQLTLQPQPTIQPQQTTFNTINNPYSQQSNDFGSQFQTQQQSALPQAGSHNPWATTTQQQQYETLKPAVTGSNNPFASSLNRPQVQQQPAVSSLSTVAEQKANTQFNQSPYNSMSTYNSNQGPPTPQKDQDPHHARLNAILAAGEGTDTFGNVGDLRIPAQHTAPGTFVNSAGQGLDRLHAAQTGNNPFFGQQSTVAAHLNPTSGAFGASQQQSRLLPAQTGPAGVGGFGGGSFGQPSNNPFGAQQPHQNRNHGGGNLIDL